MGNEAAAMEDDLDVLTGGVKHLDHALIGHQREKTVSGRCRGQGASTITSMPGAGHLDQAKLRPERGLPDKLGVDGDEIGFGEFFGCRLQCGGTC